MPHVAALPQDKSRLSLRIPAQQFFFFSGTFAGGALLCF